MSVFYYKWFDGVGHLVSQDATDSGISSTNLLFAYTGGTSHFDVLRLVPGAWKLLLDVDVYYSQPKRLSSFVDGSTTPKLIKSELKRDYGQLANWIDLLMGS
ncbi:hypothetical protein ACFL2C_01575 [Patescibacteria group bacterium]